MNRSEFFLLSVGGTLLAYIAIKWYESKNSVLGSTGYQTLQSDANQYFSGAGPGNNIAASGGVDDINFPTPF